MSNQSELVEAIMELSNEGDDWDAEHLGELVVDWSKKHELEARIDELGHCCGKCGVWHSETCSISHRRLTFRERIAELKAQQEEV